MAGWRRNLAGSNGGTLNREIDADLLEAAVERRVACVRYEEQETRVEAIVAAGRIAIYEEDLRPHPRLPVAFY